MLKLRSGVIFAALLFTGCDHHKSASQAQAEAGSAAVAESDSELTGLPPQPTNADNKTYPRATLVSLPPTSPVPAANPPPDRSALTPPPETNATASSSPPRESESSHVPTTPLPPPAPDSSSSLAQIPPPSPEAKAPSLATTDSDATQPAMNPAPPAVTSNLPQPATDTTVQEQVVVVDTSMGRIVIELDDDAAPKTCENFRKLVAEGYYDHTVFHRVIPGFIIQGGDPNSKSDNRSSYGQGGPGYTLPAEIKLKHERGAVAMARLPDTVNPQRESNGSQFYICVAACPSLDDGYTVFGHVVQGLDVADQIAAQARDARDNPLTRIEMTASLESKGKATASTTGN